MKKPTKFNLVFPPLNNLYLPLANTESTGYPNPLPKLNLKPPMNGTKPELKKCSKTLTDSILKELETGTKNYKFAEIYLKEISFQD